MFNKTLKRVIQWLYNFVGRYYHPISQYIVPCLLRGFISVRAGEYNFSSVIKLNNFFHQVTEIEIFVQYFLNIDNLL